MLSQAATGVVDRTDPAGGLDELAADLIRGPREPCPRPGPRLERLADP